MSVSILDAEQVRRALTIRDLTDPKSGPHALQLLVDAAVLALRAAWGAELWLTRKSPIVSIQDNYDRLGYSAEAAARDARYTRYVCDVALLRTQTSALIPPLLCDLARAPLTDVLLACPGVTYRRDSIDRLHTGEPHQLDLWRIRRDRLDPTDLRQMIDLVVQALLPGRKQRVLPAEHPYTTDGLQIDIETASGWIEIGECGLAHPALLRDSGLDPGTAAGLAMGIGLDRVLMLRKGIDDIRLLRSTDPRISSQMLDLEPYRQVSSMPAVRRDLSVALDGDTHAEDIGDQVRAALGDDAELVESVELLAETPHDELPPVAVARMGVAPHQKNALIRVVLRALDRTLTHDECNGLRDRIYAALHRGSESEWAQERPG
jgi:phenylalanyl-tRNA synthetase alpha chain